MAQYWYSKEAGVDAGYLKRVMEYKAEAIFPKSNRLLLRNETFKHFHFLNSIEQYCTKEQFLLLGWADSSLKEDHKSLGKYQQI